jgi:hypothetical protein
MRKVYLLLFVVLFIAACTKLTPLLSPHYPNNGEHAVVTADDCRGCHDVTTRPEHKPGDDCLICHRKSLR